MKKAFCLLMWNHHGGQVSSDGVPYGPAVTSLCNREEHQDCGDCPYMQEWLALRKPGWTYIWVCPDCANLSLRNAKEQGITVQAPGYYASGLCQRPQCTRTDDEEPLKKHSNFLQVLVIEGGLVP